MAIFACCLTLAGCTEQSGKFSSVDDLKKRRIGVLQGSVHGVYATRLFPDALIYEYKSPSDMVLAVKSEKIEAGIYSSDELRELMRQQPDLALFGPSLFSTGLGFGIHRDDNRLRASVNRFLSQIRSDGTYDGMIGRWMKQGSERMPDLPKQATGTPLTVGIVSDNGLPFTIIRDNRLTGFNIELIERYSLYAGRPVNYVDMEFGSQIAALASRKIDMIGVPLSITEERKQRIDFSDPYYLQGAYFFVLKRNIASGGPVAGGKITGGIGTFMDGIAGSFRSNFIEEGRWRLVLDGLRVTVVISVLSTLFGTAVGGVACFMRMSRNKGLELMARVYIALLRGTPVLVLLMLIFYVLFASVDIDPILVAVFAFGLNFGAYASEIFRSGIEGVGRGQFEAGIASGFTKAGTFLNIILPQAVLRILPVYKGEFISLVKMTSIVGYIAVQDLTKASDIIRSRTFDAFFPLVMVAILYFLISGLLMQSFGWLEHLLGRPAQERTTH
jgi:polar amino acid transport system substrate-binding protein